MIIAVLAASIFTLSACTKCSECTDCPLGVESTICRDGYDSNDEYQSAVDDAENLGCTCKQTVK